MKLYETIKSYDYKKLLKHNETFVFLILIGFSLAVTIINPAFLTVENIFDLIKSSAGMAILAIGVFIVLLSGGIDVSFTAVAIAGQYIAVKVLINLGIDNVGFAFLISCLTGIVLGSINAMFISIFKLPTLITTLGTLSFFHGGLLEFVGTKPYYTGEIPDCFRKFGLAKVLNQTRADGTTYGLSIYVFILLGVIVITWIVLRYTMLGRNIYAIGGNREAAKRAGFNIIRTQFFIYCYVGFLAGIMGVMHVSMIRFASPMHIVGEELHVIAAVVLGGARITGGSGSILGTLLGVAMIVVLQKNLILIGLSSYWHQFFIGLIIIVGVSITYYQSLRRSQQRVVFTVEET